MGLPTRPAYTLPPLPEPLRFLETLVRNFWWSWQPEAHALFARLNPSLWHASGHNPVALLQALSPTDLQRAAQDPDVLDHLRLLASRWTSDRTDQLLIPPEVVYLSFEFGVHESLPLYAGGLGVLAGDHLKEASGQAFPLAGVGVWFPAGYFTQILFPEGRQQETFPVTPVHQLPLEELLEPSGDTPLRIPVPLQDRTLLLRVWLVRVGRIPLFLLDPHVPENPPSLRELCHRLYPADPAVRLQQEVLFGRGAVRLMHHLGWSEVRWHLNEGHAAFSLYERLVQGEPLDRIRKTTLFTTHTPVPAGHDRFAVEQVRDMLRPTHETQEAWERSLSLARGRDGSWNMSLLALRAAERVNAVSEIHARVTRTLFAREFEGEWNIHPITNGVHEATWADPQWIQAVRSHPDPEHLTPEAVQQLWTLHQKRKKALAREIHRRVDHLIAEGRLPEAWAPVAGSVFRADILTLGFARRFTAYKRAYLLFQDPERLVRLLHHPAGPVQLILAGKAHPRDEEGKAILEEILHFAQQPEVKGRIVVLENYDMGLACLLTRGVDVWLNTPRAPLEASGTSGQKAALNGILNVSVLDGWWPEAYDGRNGWGIASDSSLPPDLQDRRDGETLYEILESEVVPLYYTDRTAWVQRMLHATRTVLERFTTRRMLTAYRQFFYAYEETRD